MGEEERHKPLSCVHMLVFDEGDRMLEEGLGDQIDALARRTGQGRQTLFFSATWPESAGLVARRFCVRPPILLRVGETLKSRNMPTNMNIVQQVEVFDQDDEGEEERETRKCARLIEL